MIQKQKNSYCVLRDKPINPMVVKQIGQVIKCFAFIQGNAKSEEKARQQAIRFDRITKNQ